MRLAWAAAAAGLLSGCAAVERAVPPSFRPTPAAAAPATALVAYLVRLRGLNERGLAAEAVRQKDKAREEPGDLAQLKVAIALSLSSQSEETEILALVEPVAKRSGDDDLKAMASFLQVQATERRRLRESATTAGSRLRDERRASEALKLRADALQERAAQLQQKLDALTELEKSLSDRQAQGH
jgi:hypothetical protein